MTNRPTGPLIIIDKGEYCGTDISGTTATPSTKTTSVKQFPPGAPAWQSPTTS